MIRAVLTDPFRRVMQGMRLRLGARMAVWVRRRQGEDSLPLTLQRRRLYILPTRAGIGFGALLTFMLVAGLNYGNSLALFLTFLLGGFLLVTMHQCHRNLLGIRLLAASAPATFAQRTGALRLTFANDGPLDRFRVEAGLPEQETAATDLPSGARQSIDVPVPAPTRGIVHISRIRVTTTHPFGLFRAWTWIHAPIQMLVYPRPSGVLPLPETTGHQSGTRSPSQSGADEWIGLRPFRDGDSPRQVDWKAYAREAPLLVKEYAAAGSELHRFQFIQLANLGTEARLEQLARWVLDADTRGDRYALELPGVHVMPDRGPEHLHRCLSALAAYGLAADTPATQEAAAHRLGRQTHARHPEQPSRA